MPGGLKVYAEDSEGFSVPVNIGLNHLVVSVLKIPGLDVCEGIFAENGDVQILVFTAVGDFILVLWKGTFDEVVGYQVGMGAFLQADQVGLIGVDQLGGCL